MPLAHCSPPSTHQLTRESAFNYPFQLTFGPLIGAIAAGCTAVVKPSEMTPESARVTASIISRLDPTCYATVLGAVEETTKLLELKWDKICYTGNSAVARIVAAAAAKHLTPTLLELGGLNPVIITSNADAKLAARRTVWTKIHNCGQICIAADYALVHPSAEAAFVEGYKASVAEFLPNGTYDPKNYGHIVNRRHFDRITGLLARSAGETVLGGQSDGEKLWIEPTLVRVDSPQDALLSEEIFGPILPYLLVDTTTEMCSLVAQIGDTPLAVYAFSNDKAEQEQILTTTRSGGATINDAMFHAVIQTVPFGGVGESGSGFYRGKHSFHAFTHRRSLANQPGWTESQLRVRYPPYSDALLNKFKRTSGLGSANFDREGKVYKVPVWKRLAFLGAAGVKGGLLRYILTLLSAWALSGFLKASK